LTALDVGHDFLLFFDNRGRVKVSSQVREKELKEFEKELGNHGLKESIMVNHKAYPFYNQRRTKVPRPCPNYTPK